MSVAKIIPDIRLAEIRIGKKASLAASGLISAIDKQPLAGRAEITDSAVRGDEYGAPHLHGGPEQAILHYPLQHYEYWRQRYPNRVDRMVAGGFGENFVADGWDESTVCIGDIVTVGEVRLQVSMPRQPCIRLNHRFDIAGMAVSVQQISKTGWYYRVLQPGTIQAGDTLQLAERPCPQWPLARIQHHLYVDTSNLAVMRELAELPLLAPLLRNLFAQRLQREQTEDWQSRLGQEGVTAAHVIAQARAEGRLPLRVERIQYETARIKSILLASIDGSALPPAPAGGHLQLYLPGGRMRQYSLCPTGDDHSYAIAVALEADGRGGSRWLHETLQEGDVIATSLPQDSYPPANGNGLHVMFAGGIGITPFLSMIAHFRRSGRRYRLYYTCRRPEEAVFVDALRALCGTDLNLHVSGEGRGRLDLPAIVAALPEDAHVYCCGPQAMVSALQQAMPGSAKQRLHVEAFAPPAASGQHDGYRVTLASSGRQLDVAPGQRLLDALRNGGVEVPSSCETGNCGSCVMRYSEGHAMHFDTCLTDATRASFLAACVSHAISPSITLAL